jgi:hypothetical protein
MAHDEDAKKTLQVPFALVQNPAPNPATTGQAYQDDKALLSQKIMSTFRAVLPSNYVAQVNGPWYSLQFQAMAEQLAEIQISGTEVYADSGFDFTRTDFLWQVMGSLVFPTNGEGGEIPSISEDIAYREFLHKMVLLLLQGATKAALEGGLEALDPDVVATITERYLEAPPRDTDGAFTIEDQFLIDIFIEGSTPNTFPADPFVLQKNAALVIAALKPAHVFYGYTYLFRDAFDKIASDAGGFSFDLDAYHYADLRKWCLGAKRVSGTGDTLVNRALFSDSSVSFSEIRTGATLTLSAGANKGSYRVSGTQALLSGLDATPRPYVTSTGDSGTLTALSGDTVYDAYQDWGGFAPGTTLTVSLGPNAGSYRLDTVLGQYGGPIGTVGISGSVVRLSPSTLILDRRMPSAATAQAYVVAVDRLGVQTPRVVSGEDSSLQFTL